LQAKVVMAKLYLNKLFPKLVSSLAVLLLLCQFGYVVCKETGFSDSPLLAEGEGTHDIFIQKKEENLFIC